ncbi:MAG TPA: ThuA domain-containing protein [Kiritimatiellia bacterium]|nr:ThuA domain-containing protein [Kiritimatiellia bacterium]
MKNTLLFLPACAFALALSTQAATELKPPSAEEAARIEKAAPARATAQPKRARRVVVVNQCEGFVHSSIPYAALAFDIMGRKTGAFSVTAVNDLSILEKPEFDTFDAIVMNNTTLRQPLLDGADEAREARAEQRFLDFVRSGKGLVGVHAATDCLYTWPAYGELIGGYFDGHPWSEEVGVKLDDPGHPLLAAFKGLDFTVADEIYAFRNDSRDTLRVLMSLDVMKTNMNKQNIKRKDNDFAVAWLHEYGKGRVFYFSLGHRHEIFWNPAVLQCYLDGIQYALGDLPADATPSSRLTEGYLRQSRAAAFAAGMARMLAELATYKLAVNDAVAKQVDAFVDEHLRDPLERRELLSQGLARVAADPQATADGRALACRKLSLAGTDNAVPALAKLIDDPALGSWSRYALARLPGKAADDALVAALKRTRGADRLAVAALTGARRLPAALPALAELAATGEDAAAVAAEAMGSIGGKEAAQALAALQAGAKGAARAAVDRALLACADRARTDGSGKAAQEIYARLLGAETAEHVRAAAFYGSNLSAGSKGVDAAIEALKGADLEQARAGARLVRDMSDKAVVTAAAAALPAMPEQNRIMALAALAGRGDRAAQEGVLAVLPGPGVEVSLAALQALEALGGGQAVKAVMAMATGADADRDVRKAAAKTLGVMSGPGVEKELVAQMLSADVKVQAAYVKVLGARQARGALEELFAAARSADAGLAEEARKAISLMVRAEDLSDVVALLVDTGDAAGLRELERIVVKAARTTADQKVQTAAVLKALRKKMPASARGALLSALAQLAVPATLPELLAAAKDSDVAVRRAAIQAVAEYWPNAEPLQALREASLKDADAACRVAALGGYARLLALPGKLPVKEKLALYREALDLAKDTKEKRVLIEGLGALVHPEALAFVKPFMQEGALSADACRAALKIREGLNGGAFVLTGSVRGAERNALDNDPKTRWTTGASMRGGEWFMVDLGYEGEIRTIHLDAGPTGNDYPRGYEVYVSLDGEQWGEPVVKGGNPQARAFTITLPPTTGRFVKIVQTGKDGLFWSINEIRVNGAPDVKRYPQLDRSAWKASAFNGAGGQRPEHAIDGDLTTRWGTGKAMKTGDWFAVDLGAPHTVHAVVMNAAKSGGDYPRECQIFTSLDGATWCGPVGLGKGEGALTTIPVLPLQARHVKIVQTGNTDYNWWSIYDLQILGE